MSFAPGPPYPNHANAGPSPDPRAWVRGAGWYFLRDRISQPRAWWSIAFTIIGVFLLWFLASEFADEAMRSYRGNGSSLIVYMMRHPILLALVAAATLLFTLPAYFVVVLWFQWGGRVEIDPATRRLLVVDRVTLFGADSELRQCDRGPYVLTFDEVTELVVKTFPYQFKWTRHGRAMANKLSGTAVIAMPSGLVIHRDTSASRALDAGKRIAKSLGVPHRVDHQASFRQLPENPGAIDTSHPPQGGLGHRLLVVWSGAFGFFFLFGAAVSARIRWEDARIDPSSAVAAADTGVIAAGAIAAVLCTVSAVAFIRFVHRSKVVFLLPAVAAMAVVMGAVATPSLGRATAAVEGLFGRDPQFGGSIQFDEKACTVALFSPDAVNVSLGIGRNSNVVHYGSEKPVDARAVFQPEGLSAGQSIQFEMRFPDGSRRRRSDEVPDDWACP
ncbi:MAG: hypothetical protein AAGN82_21900 [Myxococcota bacterium]